MKPCPMCATPVCDVCGRATCNHEDDTGAYCVCPPPDLAPLDAVQITAACPTCDAPLRAYVTPKQHGMTTLDTRDESHDCARRWDRDQTIVFDNRCADAFAELQHWFRPGNLEQMTACGASVYAVSCSDNILSLATCPLCEGERRRDLCTARLALHPHP